MKILIDMNLSPQWVAAFEGMGISAIHWSTVGPATAPDADILHWAAANGYVLFTHDLDFGAILAASGARGPSVLQVKTQDVLPARLAPIVQKVLSEYEELMLAGAILVIDEARARIRILPV